MTALKYYGLLCIRTTNRGRSIPLRNGGGGGGGIVCRHYITNCACRPGPSGRSMFADPKSNIPFTARESNLSSAGGSSPPLLGVTSLPLLENETVAGLSCSENDRGRTGARNCQHPLFSTRYFLPYRTAIPLNGGVSQHGRRDERSVLDCDFYD